MTIELDKTDFELVTLCLLRAAYTHESLMTDPNVCQVNRDRHREYAKMARGVWDLMYKKRKQSEGDTK